MAARPASLVAAPPHGAGRGGALWASRTICAASSRARRMISSACRDTSSRSGAPIMAPLPACSLSRRFSSTSAVMEFVSSSRNASTSRIR